MRQPTDPHPGPAPSKDRDRKLLRLQAISGLVFAVFLSLHLLNVMASVFGPGLYDAFQVRIRPLYQFPLFEVGVLFSSLLLHIAAGVMRIRQRPRSRDWGRLPLRTRLHRASAYFLLAVILLHITATRMPALLDGVWLGFAGLSFSMTSMPGIFYPYYALLGLCGLYHGSYGVYLALRGLGVRLPSVAALGVRAWAPLTVAAVLVVLGVLSFGGNLYAIDDPSQSSFARWVAERIGTEP